MNNKNSGKGMTPKKGYNIKNWYDNYDAIIWAKENLKKDTSVESKSCCEESKKCCDGKCSKDKCCN